MLKVKEWKKYYNRTDMKKEAGVAILISEKIDFKTKTIKRDKECHYIILKDIVHQEDVTLINICTQHRST